jgi:C4-dicarboxylate-specific signal transduction histidine kinase
VKLVTPGNPEPASDCEFRRLVSDLFHQLSQPLTTLCCSLELALLQTPTADQYGHLISQTLIQAEKASLLATAIRELIDAGQAAEGSEILELRKAVDEAIDDLLPVAESAGIQLCYRSGPACRIWFNPSRLRQGLFHLLGFVLSSSARGAVVKIDLKELAEEVVLGLTVAEVGDVASTASPEQELSQRLGLGIARTIFEAARGSLSINHSSECRSVEVRLLRGAGRAS